MIRVKSDDDEISEPGYDNYFILFEHFLLIIRLL